VIPIFAPLGEEPGWRGLALPRLLADRPPFEATLILGLIVAVWHVPLIVIASEDLAPISSFATVAGDVEEIMGGRPPLRLTLAETRLRPWLDVCR
jgi:hypothetical protein